MVPRALDRRRPDRERASRAVDGSGRRSDRAAQAALSARRATRERCFGANLRADAATRLNVPTRSLIRNLRRSLWIPWLGFRGLFKLTGFRHVTVLSGVGVGGGSLVYAATLPVPKNSFFESAAWSSLADWKRELAPHYGTAQRMLGATPVSLVTPPDRLLRSVAEDRGMPEAFDHTNVSIYLAGGVLGSVNLLLDMKHDPRGLPNLSPRVGSRIRTNSESLVFVTTPKGEDLSKGIAIGSIFQADAVSANPGVNPSLTIAALAERAMSFVPARARVAAPSPPAARTTKPVASA